MKVYLRLGKRPHPLYFELIKNPPEGIEYVTPTPAHYSKKPSFFHRLKLLVWEHYTNFVPPATFVDTKACPLIHSTNNILVLNKQPWVIDVESVGGLFSFKYAKMNSRFYRNRIAEMLSSPHCKRILPWTSTSAKSIKAVFPQREITEKLEVVYPAQKAVKQIARKKSEKTRLLFVGRRFYEKGGLELLKAFEMLEKKYDVELTMITQFPEELHEKFGHRNLRVFPSNFPQNKLRGFYEKADLLVFPTYVDTFGAVVLDAMNASLPVVSTKVFSVPEIVEDEKTGFLVDPLINPYDENGLFKLGKWKSWNEFLNEMMRIDKSEFVKKLAKKIAFLIEDAPKRRSMGLAGWKRIESGRFSISERNRKLKKIYEEALS